MASTGDTWRLGRRPELDGVRGLAILLVLVGHALAPYGYGSLAAAGVTVFFALSGYLITGILLGEHARRGALNLRRFYARRMTRLAPPLLAMLAVTGVVMRPSWEALLPALTWTGNYAGLAGVDVAPYGHTWSLAVEEQFYLLWPLVLGLLLRRRSAVVTLAVVVAAMYAWRLYLTGSGSMIYAYSALETAAVPILGGALVRLARWRLSAVWAAASAAGMVAVAVAASVAAGWTLWLVVPALVTPFAVTLVAAAEQTRWLGWRPLVLCGVASYSLYLWHEPVSHYVSGELAPLGVACGVAIGLVAFWLLERPLMAWRERSTRTGSGDHRVVVGVGAGV